MISTSFARFLRSGSCARQARAVSSKLLGRNRETATANDLLSHDFVSFLFFFFLFLRAFFSILCATTAEHKVNQSVSQTVMIWHLL